MKLEPKVLVDGLIFPAQGLLRSKLLNLTVRQDVERGMAICGFEKLEKAVYGENIQEFLENTCDH